LGAFFSLPRNKARFFRSFPRLTPTPTPRPRGLLPLPASFGVFLPLRAGSRHFGSRRRRALPNVLDGGNENDSQAMLVFHGDDLTRLADDFPGQKTTE